MENEKILQVLKDILRKLSSPRIMLMKGEIEGEEVLIISFAEPVIAMEKSEIEKIGTDYLLDDLPMDAGQLLDLINGVFDISISEEDLSAFLRERPKGCTVSFPRECGPVIVQDILTLVSRKLRNAPRKCMITRDDKQETVEFTSPHPMFFHRIWSGDDRGSIYAPPYNS